MRTGTKILTGKGWEWQEVDFKRNKVFNVDGTPKIIPSHKIEATIDDFDELDEMTQQMHEGNPKNYKPKNW